MHLDEFIKSNGMKKNFLADKIGISLRSLYNILTGGDMPLSTAIRIVKATNYKVTFDDLAEFYDQCNRNNQKDDSKKCQKKASARIAKT